MHKLLPTFILALGLTVPAAAQVSGGEFAPLTIEEIQAAHVAVMQARARVNKDNPTPSAPGEEAKLRGTYEYLEAARLYRNACNDARDEWSCVAVGELYEQGLGVTKDFRQAAAFYERALAINPANAPAKALLAIVRPAPTPTAGLAPFRDPKKLLSRPFAQGAIGFMPFATEFEWLNFCFAAEQNGVSGIDTDKIIGSLTKDGRFSSYTAGKSPDQLAEFGKNAVLSWLNFKKISPDEAQLTVESCSIHFPK
jgi:TPR repeat protein